MENRKHSVQWMTQQAKTNLLTGKSRICWVRIYWCEKGDCWDLGDEGSRVGCRGIKTEWWVVVEVHRGRRVARMVSRTFRGSYRQRRQDSRGGIGWRLWRRLIAIWWLVVVVMSLPIVSRANGWQFSGSRRRASCRCSESLREFWRRKSGWLASRCDRSSFRRMCGNIRLSRLKLEISNISGITIRSNNYW